MLILSAVYSLGSGPIDGVLQQFVMLVQIVLVLLIYETQNDHGIVDLATHTC